MINFYITSRMLLFHVLLGIISSFSSFFITVWIYFVLLYSIYKVISTKNEFGHAHFFAAYIIGIELLLRMTGASVNWEFGKFVVILLFLLAIFLEKRKKNIPLTCYMFILFLVPAIIKIDTTSFHAWTRVISFNLGGLIALILSVAYFYERKISKDELNYLFILIVLPILSSLIVIILRMGDISSITFNNEANLQTSGGFGPNQVATTIGFGILIICLSIFLKLKMFGLITNLILMISFLFFGFLTFSRGGIISPIIAIIIGFIFNFTKTDSAIKVFSYILIGILILNFSWNYLYDITDGYLEERYFNVLSQSESEIFTNRLAIIDHQIAMFYENILLGMGVGSSKNILIYYDLGSGAATHTEFARLLAEHGIFGLFNILILFLLPIKSFFKTQDFNKKLFIIISVTFSFLTMFHSALRLALAGYIYGLSLINFQFHYNEE